MTAPTVEVIEIAPGGVEVVEIGDDARPTPIYVPGTGSTGGALPVLHVVDHVQAVPQSVWTVEHDPGTAVGWVLRTADGDLGWNYVVEPVDPTTTRVSMDTPTAGTINLIMRRA